MSHPDAPVRPHWRKLELSLVRLSFALAVCAGMPTVEPQADTDTEATSSSSSSTAPTTGDDSANGSDTTPATSSASTSAPGTTASDDETSSSGEGGFLERPDIGGRPAGVCLGVDEIGHLATISAATPDPVDLTCDPTPHGCGGDVVGTWTTVAHCGLEAVPNFFENDCSGSTMEMLGSVVEGTRTFEEDGGYASDTSLVLDVEIVLDPLDCFGIDCETFGDVLNDADNNLEAVCDVSEASDCTCLMTITNEGTSAGSWEIEGDAVVLTFNGEAQDPVPLCVDGDRLEIWDALHESQVFEETPCEDATDCEEALGDAYETWYCLM